MSTKTSIQELMKMSLSELEKERRTLDAQVAKMRLGLTMGKEKNHGAYRTLKKQVARINTAISLQGKGLNAGASKATMRAPESKSSDAPQAKRAKKASPTRTAASSVRTKKTSSAS